MSDDEDRKTDWHTEQTGLPPDFSKVSETFKVRNWLNSSSPEQKPSDKLKIVQGVEGIYRIGDRVLKYTGDYKIEGEIRSVFYTAGDKLRYVVEHKAEGGGSFLHIYSPANLKAV